MCNLENIKEKLKEILLNIAENKVEPELIQYDSDIVELKLLNSISFLKLVNQIETEFDIEFEIEELSPESFCTIEQAAQEIQKKLNTNK
jgi:acyl carrier protein